MKVIFAGGLCDQDFIIYTLEKTVRDGHWLVFNNCHLVEHWDAKLVARFNQLFSPFGGKSVTSDNGNWISVTAIKQSGTEKRLDRWPFCNAAHVNARAMNKEMMCFQKKKKKTTNLPKC